MIFEVPVTFAEWLILIMQVLGVLVLFVFLLVGIRLLKILRFTQDILEDISDIVGVVYNFIWQPAQLVRNAIKKVKSWFKR